MLKEKGGVRQERCRGLDHRGLSVTVVQEREEPEQVYASAPATKESTQVAGGQGNGTGARLKGLEDAGGLTFCLTCRQLAVLAELNHQYHLPSNLSSACCLTCCQPAVSASAVV
jgi:hypothetical protein